VIDLDLERFFDRVNHDMLMARVAARVSDKRVLRLIRAFLNAGVMEDGLVRPVDEGTPQGGPLSPLLSNLVLDDLDRELSRRGHRFCRYADDCNIYVRSRRAGERVMASVTRFLTQKLKLKVNEAKSAVAQPVERKFLGFTIANDGAERRIAPKALDKFKVKIRDLTSRPAGEAWSRLSKTSHRILSAGADTSVSVRRRLCSRSWKHGYAGDYARISGGSGETAITASRNCAAVASRSSMRRSRPARRQGVGACPHIPRSRTPCATMSSMNSACPEFMSPQKLSPVEPPW
jgi:hypothetical protein